MELTEAGAHMDTVNVHGETPFEAATTGVYYEVMKMCFGDNASKNYTFHIVVVIFLPGNLKINTYKGQSESNASCFLSPYIPVLRE
jgi:hypothetical protein